MRGLLGTELAPICFGSLKHIKPGACMLVTELEQTSHFIYSPRCDQPRLDTVYENSCCDVQITSKLGIISPYETKSLSIIFISFW